MDNKYLNMWNEYKMVSAPIAALFLWLISVICFVFGLKFTEPITVAGYNVTIYLSFGLAICNTIIQLIGNDMKMDDNDRVFFWIWLSSYILGISSNTNSLLQIIGIDSKLLEFAIALALGAIIEIAPEKLIKMWLLTVKDRVKKTTQKTGTDSKPILGKGFPPIPPTYRPIGQQGKGTPSQSFQRPSPPKPRPFPAGGDYHTPSE